MSGPIGTSVSEAAARRRSRSHAYKREDDRTAAAAAIAKLVIHRRTVLELSQEELAHRAKTSNTAISRLENGRSVPNVATLQRIFRALRCRLVVGYVDDTSTKSQRAQELVAV